MKRHDPRAVPQIEAIMQQARRVRPMPDIVRARLLSRARAAISAPIEGSVAPPPWVVPSRGRRVRFAMAAGAVLMIVAAGATAALHEMAARRHEIASRVDETPPAQIIRPVALDLPSAPDSEPAVTPVRLSRSQRTARALSPKESYAAELRLLQRAQSHYASHDYFDTLVLVAEHAQRFPKGRLVEEREGLRIRSLAGAGRSAEAHRALIAFARHFPRSALLPRLQQTAGAVEE